MNFINFIAVGTTTLSNWRKLKEQQVDPQEPIHHKMVGRKSNAAKDDIIYDLFKVQVERLRSPTGKTRGRRKFYFPASLKRVAPTVACTSPKYKKQYANSFYEKFQSMIQNLCAQGTVLMITLK